MQISLTVNGFSDLLEFPDQEIATIHTKLLDHFHEIYLKKGSPIIVFFAAPPATGKSTLAALWEELAESYSDYPRLQSVSIDGFHYPNRYLLNHYLNDDENQVLLKEIKGAPETYNTKALYESLTQLKRRGTVTWPYYDRNIHDPVPDAVILDAPIIVIEGNWLLLKEAGWEDLSSFADITIFHEAEKEELKDRLIQRKIRGGYSQTEAEAHVNSSDLPNITRVLQHSGPADIILSWDRMHQKRLLDFTL